MVQLLVTHKVKDFDAWLPVFRAHEATRTKFGGLGAVVYRGLADANEVQVQLGWTSVEDFQRFLKDSDLPQAMADAGVIGPPEVAVLAPIGPKR